MAANGQNPNEGTTMKMSNIDFLPARRLSGWRRIYCLGLWFALAGSSHAAVWVASFDDRNLAIPDGSLSGVSDTQTISTPYTEITSITVSLDISAIDGYSGDLYATLIHDGGYVVLLNRPGRTLVSGFGYSDGQIEVTFAAGAGNGDVHDYRLSLTGSDTTPLTGPLSGTWEPDGRTTDPLSVLRTDSRMATLESFNGLDPNGNWTLFVADLSSGSAHQLDGWGLELTLVPEPGAWAVVTGLSLLGLLVWREKRRIGI
jgi:subtilisin-like proprotein convertase family protein